MNLIIIYNFSNNLGEGKMDNNWISDELNFINLGDQRLNKRLTKLTENFLKSPESSINQACEN